MKFKSIKVWLLLASVSAIAQVEVNKLAAAPLCPVSALKESANSKSDWLGIEQVMKDWEQAVQKVDLEVLGSLVTHDAEFWTHGADPLVGREALIAAFEPFLTQYEMHQQYDCQELIIAGDWAFSRGLEVNKLKDRTSGEIRISKQRAFSVLKKDHQGQWRFARGMTNRPPED